MASTDNVLTPNERKWLALALLGLAFRNGGNNPGRLDPKVEQMTLNYRPQTRYRPGNGVGVQRVEQNTPRHGG